jgi:hypothetical protein
MILPKDVEAWLRERAAADGHGSVEDVVAELVAGQKLAELDIAHDDHLWAKPAVDEALRSLEKGEGSPLADVAARVGAALAGRRRA